MSETIQQSRTFTLGKYNYQRLVDVANLAEQGFFKGKILIAGLGDASGTAYFELYAEATKKGMVTLTAEVKPGGGFKKQKHTLHHCDHTSAYYFTADGMTSIKGGADVGRVALEVRINPPPATGFFCPVSKP